MKQKKKIAAFKYLIELKNSHSKVKDIQYEKLEPQSYIVSEKLTNEEVYQMFALRSRMVPVKGNFSSQYKSNSLCKFGCNVKENQEHLLECKVIIDKLEDKFLLTDIEHQDLFGTIENQIEIIKVYVMILKIKEDLEENMEN